MSPNIGNLLKGVLIPNLLNNPFASCLLINLDFLLPHIAHFDNIIILPLLVLETCGLHFKHYDSISSFFLKSLGKKRFVYSVKLLLLNMKLINPIQKYPYIIESFACILKIFVLKFLFLKAEDEGRLINALISLGICSTPKLS